MCRCVPQQPPTPLPIHIKVAASCRVQGKLTGAMIHVLGLHLPLIAERHFLEVWRPELPPDLETEAYEDRTQLLDAAVRLLERLWPRDAAPV